MLRQAASVLASGIITQFSPLALFDLPTSHKVIFSFIYLIDEIFFVLRLNLKTEKH
jgi:hypothetical protein